MEVFQSKFYKPIVDFCQFIDFFVASESTNFSLVGDLCSQFSKYTPRRLF